MPSENQIRITIPSWIAELKGWSNKTQLQVVTPTNKDNRPITQKDVVIIKEIKK